jgi:hypothetical protein
MGSEWGVDIIVFRSETVASCKAYALALLARCWTSASVRKEAIKGHRLMVMIGGQDVALDHSRTLAQSGILAGSTLKLKSTGLLGGMPTGHPEPSFGVILSSSFNSKEMTYADGAGGACEIVDVDGEANSHDIITSFIIIMLVLDCQILIIAVIYTNQAIYSIRYLTLQQITRS